MEEPKIRFKGFQEEWKKKNIGSSCSISIGEFVIKTKQRANAPYPVYNGGSTNTGYYDQYNQIGPKVIVSARGANAGFVNKEEGKYWAGNSCYSIGTKDETNWLFLYYAFKFYQDKYIKAQQAANIPSVSKSDIQKTILLFPSINEQQSIASYFQHLDALIQSTTKKIESLKQVKAASLQSMFPQEGETTPRVRFKGFEGEWEKVSFGQFGSVAMCKRIFKDQTMDKGEVPFYKIGTFAMEPDAYISKELFIEYKSKFSFPQKGDILISAAGTIGRTIQYNGEDAYFQDSNIVWLKHGNEIDNTFLMYIYSLVKWNGLEGATIKRLYNNIILETEFLLPPVEEQRAIASFFTILDRKITLQSQQLEKLKQIKAACLDNMFV